MEKIKQKLYTDILLETNLKNSEKMLFIFNKKFDKLVEKMIKQDLKQEYLPDEWDNYIGIHKTGR